MEVCPYNPSIVAIGGNGGMNIWNISPVEGGSSFKPIYSRKPSTGSTIMDLHFDPCGYGVYYTTSDSNMVGVCVVRIRMLLCLLFDDD